MAQVVKKPKIEKDRFTTDGVRLFNPSLPHGTVYSDGFIETKFIQEFEGRPVDYRGDGTPVGYKQGKPLPPTIDEVETENQALKDRIAQLEAGQARMVALLEKLNAGSTAPVAATKEADSGAGKPGKK